jgi:hypothetical protein
MDPIEINVSQSDFDFSPDDNESTMEWEDGESGISDADFALFLQGVPFCVVAQYMSVVISGAGGPLFSQSTQPHWIVHFLFWFRQPRLPLIK